MNGGSAIPGDSLLYIIKVKNTGTVAATGVVVNDTLPTGLNIKTIYNSGTLSGRIITWPTITTLAVGDSVRDSVKVTIDSSVVNGLARINVARIASNGITQLDSATVTPLNVAVLAEHKAVDRATGVAGDTLSYTFTYGNTGTDTARSVVITDTIPTLTSYVAGSLTGTGATYDTTHGRILITRSTIAPGVTNLSASYKVVVNSSVPIGFYTIRNIGVMTATNGTTKRDTAQSIIAATVIFTTSTKTNTDLNGGSANSGDSIRYTITVRNTGNTAATSVAVYDTLPAHLTPKAGTISNSGTYNGGTRVIS